MTILFLFSEIVHCHAHACMCAHAHTHAYTPKLCSPNSQCYKQYCAMLSCLLPASQCHEHMLLTAQGSCDMRRMGWRASPCVKSPHHSESDASDPSPGPKYLPLWPLAPQTSLPTPRKFSSDCSIPPFPMAPIPSPCSENPNDMPDPSQVSLGYFPACPLCVLTNSTSELLQGFRDDPLILTFSANNTHLLESPKAGISGLSLF